MKKLIAIMLCVLFLFTGCNKDTQETNNDIETTTDQIVEEASIDVFGEVKVDTIKEIIIDFPATVENIYIKDGQKIKKGDKIISLSFDSYEIDIKKKQNEINFYENQLAQLRQNINPLSSEVVKIKNELNIKQGYLLNDSDPDVQKLKRSLEIAESELNVAKKEHEVNKEIYDMQGISDEELELSLRNLQAKEKAKKDILQEIEQIKINRKLEVDQLNASLSSTQAQASNTDMQKVSEILELESKLEIAKLDLEIMQKKLSKSFLKDKSIIADIDNMIVYDILCNEGSMIDASSGAIIKGMNEDTLFVSADIPEEFINKVKVGSSADIVPYADKNIVLKGSVVRLSEKAIKQNGETIIKADISIEGEKSILKPGLTVDIKIYE